MPLNPIFDSHSKLTGVDDYGSKDCRPAAGYEAALLRDSFVTIDSRAGCPGPKPKFKNLIPLPNGEQDKEFLAAQFQLGYLEDEHLISYLAGESPLQRARGYLALYYHDRERIERLEGKSPGFFSPIRALLGRTKISFDPCAPGLPFAWKTADYENLVMAFDMLGRLVRECKYSGYGVFGISPNNLQDCHEKSRHWYYNGNTYSIAAVYDTSLMTHLKFLIMPSDYYSFKINERCPGKGFQNIFFQFTNFVSEDEYWRIKDELPDMTIDRINRCLQTRAYLDLERKSLAGNWPAGNFAQGLGDFSLVGPNGFFDLGLSAFPTDNIGVQGAPEPTEHLIFAPDLIAGGLNVGAGFGLFAPGLSNTAFHYYPIDALMADCRSVYKIVDESRKNSFVSKIYGFDMDSLSRIFEKTPDASEKAKGVEE